MPTGFTAPIQDGDVTTLNEYAWQCARNFGALITMRDQATDAMVPARLEPDQYHATKRDEAKGALLVATMWSDDRAEGLAQADYEQASARWKEVQQRDQRTRTRYQAMLAEVRANRPANPGAQAGLWDFMESQLVESIQFDCGLDFYTVPVLLDGPTFRANAIAKAKKDIEYHAAQQIAEDERTAERNAWLAALADQVGPPPSADS